MKGHRLVIHAERYIARALPEMALHVAADLLLRLEVGRLEPGLAQGLHLGIGRPAEPRLGAAAADRDVGAGRDVPEAAEISIEDVPAAMLDRLLAGAPRHDGAPFERLEIDVHADLLQDIGGDRGLGPDRWDRRRGEHYHLLAIVTGGGEFLLDLVIILRTAGDLDADIAGQRRPRH